MTDTTVNPALTADAGRRLISGVVLPWGAYGRTSAGVLRARAGSVRLPADLSRVKLFGLGHDRESPVGYAVSAADTVDGLRLTFRIAPTPAGDHALVEATARTRDAFSVELDDLVIQGDEIARAALTGVALVAVPAWADSRVESVAASAQPPEVTPMDPETDPQTQPAQPAQPAQPVQPVQPAQPAQPAQPVQPVQPAQPAQPVQPGEGDDTDNGGGQLQAGAPRGLTGAPTGTRVTTGRRSMSRLYAAMAARATDQGLGPELTAALADITHTANAWVQPTQYDAELWSGVAYQRQIVPLFTQRPLTSYKISGWRWKVRPVVDDYPGDKAPVPTNPAETEPAETTAKRLAGAHDIDRKFKDFGDAGFFQSYYEAMSESYAYQSDDRAASFLVTSAAPTVTEATDLIGVVTTLAFQIQNTTHSPATFALCSQADWLRLMLSTTMLDAPAWLSLLPVPLSAFKPVPFLAAGAAVVGTRPAISWYEREGSPIKVETVSLQNGGIDGGVFGYYGTLLNDARGLLKGTVAQPVPAADDTATDAGHGRRGGRD